MSLRDRVCDIAQRMNIDIPAGWSGVQPVWPLLERMRGDGAVVLLKLDGERTGPDDNGPYTALASGAPLRGDMLRIDATEVEDALAYIISEYAKRVWDIPS